MDAFERFERLAKGIMAAIILICFVVYMACFYPKLTPAEKQEFWSNVSEALEEGLDD